MKKSSSEEFKKRVRESKREVARRRKAEETLKNENILFNSPYSIAIFDADGHYAMGNKAFSDLFGGTPPPDFSIFNDPIMKKAGFQEQVLKLKKGEKDAPIELWYNPHEVRPDLPDKKVCVKGVAFPVMDNNGKVENIVIMHEDITERKKIEEALRESEEKYRNLVENINDVIYTTDGNGNITYISPSVESLSGYSPSEIIGQNFSKFTYQEDLQRVVDQFKELKHGSIFQSECRVITKTGKTHCILFSSRPKYSEGQLICVQGVCTDITERKQIEKELMEAQKELEIETINLEETNTALKVLLKHQDEEKHEWEKSIITSLNNLILPYIEKLKSCTTDDRQKTYINIIETNLLEITKPFINHIKGFCTQLSPTEIQIAHLIRENKTTKDIANILYSSETTVFFHRRNIRNKLGIKNKKSNLCSYLQSFESK